MSEYLAPGVYVEETSYRAKSIEGVSTSTAGFIGPTRTGPISGQPELLTSFADFERYYGGLEDLEFGTNYLAHGVRAFFAEGGKRCYVMRVYARAANTATSGHATTGDIGPAATPRPRLTARFPGAAGNMRVRFRLRLGDQVLQKTTPAGGGSPVYNLSRVRAGDVVYIAMGTTLVGNLYTVTGLGTAADPFLLKPKGNPAATLDTFDGKDILPLTVVVEIAPQQPDKSFGDYRSLGEFGLNVNSDDSLTRVFSKTPATRFAALTVPFMLENPPAEIADVVVLLFNTTSPNLASFIKDAVIDGQPHLLANGSDGVIPQNDAYEGSATGFLDLIAPDDFTKAKNGLLAFEAVPDISIIAAPGCTAKGYSEDQAFAINNAVIAHCEKMKYRIAVIDTPPNYLPTQARTFRNRRSSKYAALYYPWVVVADPRPGQSGKRLPLPPSGFVAGIYARNDTERAVFKAPANEVVRLAVDFEQRLATAHQEMLNPNGVNCFRFFEGRGLLLWGARTISDDPEWKYVNLRRYFAYLEYSIERATQWAVFENNDTPLWNNVRRMVEDFLFNEWRRGGLVGEKPEKAYFVRCDRSTMDQNDLDNGRLVCLIGVAPVKPAEFVIFRIGQWTADSPINLR